MTDHNRQVSLLSLVDICDLRLEVNYHHAQAGPWIAVLRDKKGLYVSCKDSADDHMDRGVTGWGEQPHQAILDLCKNLQTHKYIIGNDRRNIPIPDLFY